MLSTFWLRFEDKKIFAAFKREKKTFYRRVMPMITMACLTLLICIEILYRGFELGDLSAATTIINATSVLWFAFLTCTTRRWIKFTWLVCPSLIALVFYYLIWVDYDSVNASIYYKTVLGITVCFFLLVVFNEVWLLSTLAYAPFAVYFMHKTGDDMLRGTQNGWELSGRSFFCVFVFAVVAYKMEQLNK